MDDKVNVLGKELEECGCAPLTGFYRDGHCNTDVDDRGVHTVCCVVDQTFLEFLREDGNDLITAAPQYDFPGLKTGDRWCVCAGSWLNAYRAGKACQVVLEATHLRTLEIIPVSCLEEFAHH